MLVAIALCACSSALVVSGTAEAKTFHLGDRSLRQGISGTDVKELQKYLKQVGLKVTADGQFGPGTAKAVRTFQRAAALTPSGVVDAKTVAALRRATIGGSKKAFASGGYNYGTVPGRTHSLGDRIPLEKGDSGHDVKVLQDFLHRLGYKVSIDGDFGAGTFQAQEAFEKAEQLTVDGIVDANDIDVLRGQVVSGKDAPAAPKPLELAPGDHAKIGPDGLAIAPADAPDVVKQIIAAGNEIAFKPYIYGGGHGNWNDRGYDCSGSVSYALHGAGLLDRPLVSGDFPSWGQSGPGQWVTIYGNSGHVFMYVAGLRFDTSGMRDDNGSRWHSGTRPTDGYGVSHPVGL